MHSHHHDDNVDVEMCSGIGKDVVSEIAEEYAEEYCGKLVTSQEDDV